MQSHVKIIKRAIQLAHKSSNFHAVIVTGTAGYGKSTAVDQALAAVNISSVRLGNYSTPLHLYNFLVENAEQTVLIDDCAGVLASDLSMSILKAATWPQSNGQRIVKWGSSSTKVAVTEFEFKGKIVIIGNSFPAGPDAEAVKSRSICHSIQIKLSEAKRLILAAGSDPAWFDNLEIAGQAAQYLASGLNAENLSSVSLRSLRLAYETIADEPHDWKPFLDEILNRAPSESDPLEVLRTIIFEESSVKRQGELFEKRTGLKRRMFFNYKRKLVEQNAI